MRKEEQTKARAVDYRALQDIPAMAWWHFRLDPCKSPRAAGRSKAGGREGKERIVQHEGQEGRNWEKKF